MENKPKFSKKWVIVGIVIFVFVLIGIATSSSNNNSERALQQEVKPTETVENTPTPIERIKNEVMSLSHDELLKATKANPNEVLNKTYEMTLYLEQQPSATQAEFMSQPDDNSPDTILVTCNMNAVDLKGLDGASAQNKNYKPYNLMVTFTKYDSKVGLYYEAECEAK